MAIKNDLLGGTDWVDEGLVYTDLNDTFDAVVEKIQSLSAFWLNSDLYDEYENFNSYSTGAFTTNTDWDVTLTGTYAYSDIVASSNAGGTTNELRVGVQTRKGTGNKSAVVKSKTIDSNKHTFCRLYGSMAAYKDDTTTYSISFDNGTTWYTVGSITAPNITNASATGTFTSDMLVIAKGSDSYDIYIGGKKVGSNVSIAAPQIGFKVDCGYTDTSDGTSTYMYVDDIRQAKSEIQ